MDNSIEFQLSVQDSQANAEELQAILRKLAAELESQSAIVESVAAPESSTPDGTVNKGEAGGILNVKINLDSLKAFGKWLYERLIGTNTKVKFEDGEAKFEFEGRNLRGATIATVVVGVGEYGEGFAPLPGSLRDLRAMEAALQDPDCGAFEVQSFPDCDRATLETQIEQFFRAILILVN